MTETTNLEMLDGLPQNNRCLLEAIRYANLGLSTLPLRKGEKKPIAEWKRFITEKASVSTIREWFKRDPNSNLGIVTGAISGVVVIDLDGEEGLAEGKRLGLSSTLVSFTGRGKHLWFKHPGGIVKGEIRIRPGIDIRADGNMVMAPPSIHPNGRRYRWNKPVLSADKLPLFPISLFASGAVVTSDVNNLDSIFNSPNHANSNSVVNSRNSAGWIATALEEMTNGNIDDTLFKICSRLRNDGLTEADAISLLGPHASRVGAEAGHLESKVRNVWGRYQPRSTTERSVAGGSLVLHSPSNPDSLTEFKLRTKSGDASLDNLKTGYTAFDILTKGLKAGEVLTVAARTGVGKTNWVITPIREFAQKGKTVLLFSTEMSFDQIWSRYCRTLEANDNFKSHKLFICDDFTPNIERIEEAIKNVKPDLFVFDHISHIGTDYHIISKFMSEIKRLARLYDIPAIVTAQLNRNADYVEQGTRVEPRLSMIQGSDQIGQMSAQVLLLNEKRIVGDVTEIEGIVVKNRHGDKGMISFGLLKSPYYRMVEL